MDESIESEEHLNGQDDEKDSDEQEASDSDSSSDEAENAGQELNKTIKMLATDKEKKEEMELDGILESLKKEQQQD